VAPTRSRLTRASSSAPLQKLGGRAVRNFVGLRDHMAVLRRAGA